jgi:hypothetical protein
VRKQAGVPQTHKDLVAADISWLYVLLSSPSFGFVSSRFLAVCSVVQPIIWGCIASGPWILYCCCATWPAPQEQTMLAGIKTERSAHPYDNRVPLIFLKNMMTRVVFHCLAHGYN